MNVVLVSTHYYASRRRAGFHWLADAYARAGHDVTFMTASISWLSWLRRDHRLVYPVRAEANRLVAAAPGITSFVWLTPWHPANLRLALLNRLSTPRFARYGELPLGDAERKLAEADLVVFESSPGILLHDRVRRLNPRARLVYRVSDDLRLLRSHPVVIATEERIAREFDLVSVPTPTMLLRFAGARARVHHHGVRTELLDVRTDDPYDRARWGKHLVFVGIAHLDAEFLARASRLFPRHAFHVIGPLSGVPRAQNIFIYGELSYPATIPYLQHADVGLHTLRYSPGAESFGHSLKVLQYTWCRLPIIAPAFMDMRGPHVFSYRSDADESIVAAVDGALVADHAAVDRSAVRSWDDLAAQLYVDARAH